MIVLRLGKKYYHKTIGPYEPLLSLFELTLARKHILFTKYNLIYKIFCDILYSAILIM